jgi:tRNA (mo5U34)-methyltransferase
LERRGAAEVVAIDSLPSHQTGFGVASRLLESKVVYHHANLYNLERLQLGTFDLVLFLGLLYHLPDPLGGLRIVRQHCRARMFLETVIVDYGLPLADGTTVPLQQLDPRLAATPIMRFFPRDSFHQDASNYWGPNMQCVRDMLTEMEFSVVRESTDQSRAIFECVVASRPELAYAWGHATGRTPLS